MLLLEPLTRKTLSSLKHSLNRSHVKHKVVSSSFPPLVNRRHCARRCCSFSGPARAAVTPAGADDLEYSYPAHLVEESVLPSLVDGGFPPDTLISEHVRLRDVMSSDRRYFRLDPSLLECLELAEEDFPGRIEVTFDGVTTSVNKWIIIVLFYVCSKQDAIKQKQNKNKLSKVWINKSAIKGQRNARAKTKESIFGSFQHAP